MVRQKDLEKIWLAATDLGVPAWALLAEVILPSEPQWSPRNQALLSPALQSRSTA
jgi:hypothetical protein